LVKEKMKKLTTDLHRFKQIYTDFFIFNYKGKINQKLLRGVQGGGFLEKSHPGCRRQK